MVIPIKEIPGSLLCPIRAFKQMCRFILGTGDVPAFCVRQQGRLVPFTYLMLHSRLRELLGLMGQNPCRFSSHSFRRGGATFAYQAGVPGQLIKLTGDWRSSTYERYLHVPFSDKNKAATAIAVIFGLFLCCSNSQEGQEAR